ncbi:hypothetical protein [Streptococcus sanguinis]|uniref:hypothetical protein n=1 Tax=Streptococcus sanguinis TaxID=1305 RepID=UPI000F665A95|nr:hypothetical protein [Streptococcus sanguinis]MBZ2022097.1 hypothetical protein [Streptococcus sanguinis]MBZ2067361.1 hypothetical protein [Streptococcus sanguinis]MBZ2074290.1 hypothetical protein [Streptococcus sanguinis]MBZ2082420.1 hypothetical protein [Streptococcus sanguinis]MCC3165891.1 hypothetical protein [Streptococcus sanguinis]
MGRKRILPEHIKGIEHSFEDMSGRLEDKSSSLIESSATANFSSATNEVKALTKDLVPVVESFDEYLNAVADEFTRIDTEMGRVIDGGALQEYSNGLTDADMNTKKHYTQKQIDLYNDFPS